MANAKLSDGVTVLASRLKQISGQRRRGLVLNLRRATHVVGLSVHDHLLLENHDVVALVLRRPAVKRSSAAGGHRRSHELSGHANTSQGQTRSFRSPDFHSKPPVRRRCFRELHCWLTRGNKDKKKFFLARPEA